MGHSKSSSKKEVYSNIILSQETRKIPNKQTNLTPNATRERTNKTKTQQKKINIKIRADINEIKMKKTTTKNQ